MEYLSFHKSDCVKRKYAREAFDTRAPMNELRKYVERQICNLLHFLPKMPRATTFPVLPGSNDPSCWIRPPRHGGLELVEVLPERRDLLLLALALADREAEDVELGVRRHRVAALHRLPVAEGALRERLAGRSLAEGAGETEGLRNRQVRAHLHQVRTRTLLLVEDDSAALVHAVVDPALGIGGRGDVDEEDRLLQRRGGGHFAGEDAAASRRHDLPGAAVDRVRVHRHVLDVVAGRAHRLLADRALLRRPLERGDDVLLDLVQELHGHRGVDDDVRALRLRRASKE